LAALVADPLDLYDSSEIPPEAVLLAAMGRVAAAGAADGVALAFALALDKVV
jgi:hypothetical protein